MQSPVVFLKEVKTELAKVVWPTKKETIRLTTVVVGISVSVGLFLGAIDYLLTKIMEIILQK
ncbi:MAG: preprotein translocase subunit SecE [Patescibacteria group bacterium]|nr:preprotein translocase subunit SecE [Patescibacteria group bacterium]MCL5095284.1 preprotein translocase subunit SecE [Patescibacteria group bacterium]